MWGRGISQYGAVVIITYSPSVMPVLVFERFGAYGLKYARPAACFLLSIVLFVILSFLSGKTEKRMLELRNVCKALGQFRLRNISLTVQQGHYFVILGPTGSGKSVLLSTISGVFQPDSGESAK